MIGGVSVIGSAKLNVPVQLPPPFLVMVTTPYLVIPIPTAAFMLAIVPWADAAVTEIEPDIVRPTHDPSPLVLSTSGGTCAGAGGGTEAVCAGEGGTTRFGVAACSSGGGLSAAGAGALDVLGTGAGSTVALGSFVAAAWGGAEVVGLGDCEQSAVSQRLEALVGAGTCWGLAIAIPAPQSKTSAKETPPAH